LESTDKVNRQVVNHDHHRRPNAKSGAEAGKDAPLAEDTGWDGRGLGLEDLARDESEQENAGQCEEGDDATVAPFQYVSLLKNTMEQGGNTMGIQDHPIAEPIADKSHPGGAG
jgi:hypothetical protein